ncbi:MAG: ABC transporter permease subunit [Oscillospiraceae bacterium]|nr:ABC transporter permease subunit [Oscillospiraceae bacterium]
MRNVFSANLYRLRKTRAFYIALTVMAGYAVFISGLCWYKHWSGEAMLFGMEEPLLFAFCTGGTVPFTAFILAPLLSVYLGTEFSCGTLRSKLSVGRTRAEIYIANLLTCIFAAVLLVVLYLAVVLTALPAVGEFHISVRQVLLLAGTGLLAFAAYASVVNMLSALLGSKTNTALVTLLLLVLTMFMTVYIADRLEMPEFVNAYDDAGQILEEVVPNRYYLQPKARAVCEFVLDLLPTAQCIRISRLDVPYFSRMPLLSVLVTVCTSGIGLGCFQKKNLK